ncbi:hypothetical protein CPB83DRAFT_909422 [Crepidotus variabilis]|uniref:Dystroglycan-type cadherin-like domain-containing protein n=1 Tax=Crepidotus variabilis TaxID=179855 RepID=A0A9P6JLW9_9AGAR|nr:hypothetical protein CPB83DRAFT_909422 [Crepidotus variabilis]
MIIILLPLLALLTGFTFNAAFANASTTPSVTVLQSLNLQLPKVARVGELYSWAPSSESFSSTDGPMSYSTSTLPTWLNFDNSTMAFQGTPSAGDVGYPEIIFTAHGATTSTSSKFTICTTNAAEPTLNHALVNQLDPNSRAMSSIYSLRPGSALKTSNPCVRVVPKTSFSIGFDSTTFTTSNGKMFYELRRLHNMFLPEWASFNSKTVTLDAVAPAVNKLAPPEIVSLVLHASDQEGYTAVMAPFDVVSAEHELSMTAQSLPDINITLGSPFVFTMTSPADFTGVFVDDRPIHPANISELDVDTSEFSWARFDKATRTLSGAAPDTVTGTTPVLSMTLTTTFGQLIKPHFSFNLVQPYFVLPVLPSLNVTKDDEIHTSLTQYLSKSGSHPGTDGTNVTAYFDPASAGDYLHFDEGSTIISGTAQTPGSITITLTAFSVDTRSTSHTSLTIYVVDSRNAKTLAPTNSGRMSEGAHKKLVLALALSFGLVGGLCSLAGIFAIMRRWAKVEDTAMAGEEGRHAWSEKDRQWYGMMLSPNGTRIVEKSHKPVTMSNIASPGRPRGPRPNYAGLGFGRAGESVGGGDSQENLVSPGLMSKQEFLAKIKETVRQVSNKYGSKRQAGSSNRPVIGKPILVSSTRASAQPEVAIHHSPSDPFDDSMRISSRPASTFLTGSPSASTAAHSIPKRRADFAGPRNPTQVHFQEGVLGRQVSSSSIGGKSYRSEKSGLSGESLLESAMGPPTKPRLVPFTSSTRVPVPDLDGTQFNGNRVASQRAKVVKADSSSVNGTIPEEFDVKVSATSDDISMGIHYVRSLGDQLSVNHGGRSPSPALSNIRSSFASLESSNVGQKSGSGRNAMKVLVRAGERFKFCVPLTASGDTSKSTNKYSVRLTSGHPLPRFIQSDLSGIMTKGVLELVGVAGYKDLGEVTVGVFSESDDMCIATVVFEVVGKR